MRPAAMLAAAVLLSGCGFTAEGGGASCGPVEHPELQGGGHLLGEREPPVPYSSTPGTSGFHAAGAPRTGVLPRDEPLSEPHIVLALEVGQVVAAYDPDRLPDEDIQQLEELATGPLQGELTVTAFEGHMGAALTLNAWGTRRPCAAVDVETVRGFVEEHGGQGPDHS
ncbi:MAG: DUF3105 domain-containing protein [Actinobacteria bacterium]|nr:DUF3105 domain-containing protein [Actinomycetota bacterium]